MALALERVTVEAGPAKLIQDISLAVGPGRFIAVLGPNGAGKSTALGAIAGDRRLAGGRALLDGRDIRHLSPRELAERRAVIRQHAPMHFPLLVHEVVALGRHPLRKTARESEEALEHAMSAVDILHLAGRDYSNLSGGERQRVQIARALAQLWPATGSGGPRYLLMDEPTAHLDLKHQIVALEAARRFAREGGGVLCILHDIALAREFADECVLLCEGKTLAHGRAEDILTAENLQQTFGISFARAQTLSRHAAA